MAFSDRRGDTAASPLDAGARHPYGGIRSPAIPARWWPRVRLLVTESAPGIIELGVGVFAVCWGLYILNPALSTFEIRSYQALVYLGIPEGWWGAAAVTIGTSVILRAGHPDRSLARRTALYLGMAYFTFVGCSVAVSDARSPFVVTMLFVAAAFGWSQWRVSSMDRRARLHRDQRAQLEREIEVQAIARTQHALAFLDEEHARGTPMDVALPIVSPLHKHLRDQRPVDTSRHYRFTPPSTARPA